MKHFFVIMCTFVFLLCNPNFLIAADVWDGTSAESWTNGTGTESDPYLIETAAQWAYLKAQVAARNTYSGVYFLQTQDIDLNSKSCPIGTSSYPFSGIYDGGNHEIQNASSTVLFSYIKNSTIKNLTLSGTSTNSMISVSQGNCQLINCHNKSSQTKDEGYSYNDDRYLAGLVTKADTLSLYQCSNHSPIISRVTGQYSVGCKYVGGLVSYANSITMSQCFNYASIKLTNVHYAAGLVAGYQSATIIRCGNEGDISGNCYYNCYGLTGTTVIESYNTGLLSGLNGSSNHIICGIYGSIEVKGCYVRGNSFYRHISGTDARDGYNMYAIAGGNISNCYYAGTDSIVLMSSGTNVYTNTQSSDGYTYSYNNAVFVYGISSSAKNFQGYVTQNNTFIKDTLMKSQDFPAMLNEGGDYFCYDYLNMNSGYPILKWQLGDTDFYTVKAFCQESQGAVTGAGEYPNGSQIQLTATPKDHYTFTQWSDGVTDNPRTVSVTADAVYAAQFERSSYTVYINQDCSIIVE